MMDYKNAAEKIMALKNADLALRDKLLSKGVLGDGYHEEMETLHNSNAAALDMIIDAMGYPTIDKVGTAASAAAWLVIQHAIAKPDFMRKCVRLLEIATIENKVDPKNLAYLTDRVAVLEGRPQVYGTQFDWDENNVLNPNIYDDLILVNQRRKTLGLNTLEAQTAVLRSQAEKENHMAPVDSKNRKLDYERWRRKVSWIK